MSPARDSLKQKALEAVLTAREKALALLGLRNALIITMPGSTHDATITPLREIAHEQGVSEQVLEEVRLEAETWLQKIGAYR
jgi:hypothetical protein